jgi:sortase family protein
MAMRPGGRVARYRARLRRWWTWVLAVSVLLLLLVPLAWQFTRPPLATGTRPEVARPSAPPAAQAVARGAQAPEPVLPEITRSNGRLADQPLTPVVAPVALRAPAAGIAAPVDPVGVEAGSTAMEVPEDIGRAGWYRFGPAPGATEGVAVITSHVDSARSGPGAFFRLRELEVGAAVEVTLEDGRVVPYVVTGREQLPKEALPTGDLFRRDGDHALALITCGGAFNRATRSYRDNVIVWAVPAEV